MHDLCQYSADGVISADTKPLSKLMFLVLLEAQSFTILVTAFVLMTPNWRIPVHSCVHYTNTTNLPTKHIHKFLNLDISSMKSMVIKTSSFNRRLASVNDTIYPLVQHRNLKVVLFPHFPYQIGHQVLSILSPKYSQLCHFLHPTFVQTTFSSLLNYLLSF